MAHRSIYLIPFILVDWLLPGMALAQGSLPYPHPSLQAAFPSGVAMPWSFSVSGPTALQPYYHPPPYQFGGQQRFYRDEARSPQVHYPGYGPYSADYWNGAVPRQARDSPGGGGIPGQTPMPVQATTHPHLEDIIRDLSVALMKSLFQLANSGQQQQPQPIRPARVLYPSYPYQQPQQFQQPPSSYGNSPFGVLPSVNRQPPPLSSFYGPSVQPAAPIFSTNWGGWPYPDGSQPSGFSYNVNAGVYAGGYGGPYGASSGIGPNVDGGSYGGASSWPFVGGGGSGVWPRPVNGNETAPAPPEAVNTTWAARVEEIPLVQAIGRQETPPPPSA